MNLITTYYDSGNELRQNELKRCLLKNIQNKYIEKIYLLNNKIYNLNFINNIDKHNKVVQIQIYDDSNKRLKYSDAVEFINTKLPNSLCILANSDIYFNETLEKINYNNMNGKFYALLRYDEDSNGKKTLFKRFDIPRDDSQDAWIFNSPLNVDLSLIDFNFGILGCDSILASVIHNNTSLNVSNPAYDIIITHVHQTEYRTYTCDDRIHGKYGLIKPGFLSNDNDSDNVSFIDY